MGEQELRPVVVTRSEPSDGPLSSELRSLGLPVLVWPAVHVEPAPREPLEAALREAAAGAFDWIVFASRHAVAAVTEVLPAPPPGVRIAAVGQATAQVLRQRGWPVDLLPGDANAAALVAAFATEASEPAERAAPEPATAAASSERAAPEPAARAASSKRAALAPAARAARSDPAARVAAASGQPLSGRRILFPASSRALPTIAAGLTQLGAQVAQVEAYRTESSATLNLDTCRSWIARGGIGAVTFASPSAVDELEHALGKDDFDRLLSSAAAVAIGPTTARALTDRGHTPTLAESATLRGLAHTTHRVLMEKH
jgi:uroporphyrinogen-III synthase